MKTAVHFGAGTIGRGFIGDLLHDSGFEITFVDVDEAMMKEMTKQGSYTLFRINNHANRKVIDHVRGLCSLTQEDEVIDAIVGADFVTTAVWVNNLPKVAPVIAKGLAKRLQAGKEKVNVMACENAIRATDILKKEILSTGILTEQQADSIACFPNTAVDRMVFAVEVDGIKGVEVGPDDEYELPIEQNRLVDPTSEPIKGAEYTDNLDKYLERKLYVVNCCHALGGFYGFLKGYDYVLQAFNDEEILKDVNAGIRESAEMLTKKYDFTMKDFDGYLEFVVRRYQTPGVKDPVGRVCRNPIRKLANNERLIGPAGLCEEYGVDNKYLCKGAAAAFLFENSEDVEAVEIQNYIKENSIEKAVPHYTGLDPESKSAKQIIMSYYDLKKQYNK